MTTKSNLIVKIVSDVLLSLIAILWSSCTDEPPASPQDTNSGQNDTTATLYTTADGGTTWNKQMVNGIGEIIDINQFPSGRLMLTGFKRIDDTDHPVIIMSDDGFLTYNNPDKKDFDALKTDFKVADVLDDGSAYVTSKDNTIWYTTDGGNSWSQPAGPTYPAGDFNDCEKLIDGRLALCTSHGLFLTTGSNFSWDSMPVKPEPLNKLEELDVNEWAVCGVGYMGITNDGGKTWNQLISPRVMHDVVFSSYPPFSGLVVGDDNIYRYDQATQLWKQVRLGLEKFFQFAESNAENIWWVVGATGAGSGGQVGLIFQSVDNGDTWNRIDFGADVPNRLNAVFFINQDEGFIGGS